MMYVWKQRPVSEQERAGVVRIPGRILPGILMALLLLGTTSVGAADQVLSFTSDWRSDGQEQKWLDQDQRWFRTLPVAGKFLAPDFPDSVSSFGMAMDP